MLFRSDIIRGKESFPSEQWTSKWGVYDGVMFNDAATTISQLTPPFYSVVLTQSTHEPFAIPIAPKFEGSSESVKFKNAAYYTDCSLKAFIEKIKKEKWYENTLLILVADHGHILPRNRDYSDPAAFKIPLLITGPALKKEYRNFRYSVIGNQQDYAATIKSILNLPIELPFSNSLLKCKRTNFCYMNYDDGFIWKDDRSTFKLNYSNRKTTLSNPSIDSLSLKNG